MAPSSNLSSSSRIARSRSIASVSTLCIDESLGMRRQNSAISLEKHSSFIFEQINAMLDSVDNSCETEHPCPSSENEVAREALEQGRSKDGMINREIYSNPNQIGSSRMARCTSELSMESAGENHKGPVLDENNEGEEDSGSISRIRRPRRAIISRIEDDIISKGERAGKLLRTTSYCDAHVSLGCSLRRYVSFSVICENHEHHEGVARDDQIFHGRLASKGGRDIEEEDPEDFLDYATPDNDAQFDSFSPFGTLLPLRPLKP